MPGMRYVTRCIACRRRKVKCTAEKPACARCSKDGLVCPGYDKEPIRFINVTNGRPNSRDRNRKTSVKPSSAPAPFPISSVESTLLLSPNPASINLRQIVSSSLHNGPYKSIGFELPKGACFNWFADLANFVGGDKLVDLGMQSLSLVHIGKTRQDDAVLRMARICYGATLRGLQSRIVRGCRDFDFLRVNTLLCLYEAYDSAQAHLLGYVKHNSAAQAVAMAIRPDRSNSPAEINTFNCFRIASICNAFGARKGCILEEYKRPRTVPEEEFSDFTEALHDVTIKIPRVVEMSDKLLSSPPSCNSQQAYTAICKRWQSISYSLNDWFSKMSHHFRPLYKEDKTPLSDPELDFGPSFSLPSYWVSQALMHYWASRVLLYDALGQAVSWTIMHYARRPILENPQENFHLSDFSAQDTSIGIALLNDLEKCSMLLYQNQDIAARNVLQCVRFTWAKEFGVFNLAQSANSIYVVLQHFKKRKMTHEIMICAKAIAIFGTRGLALGDIFEIDSKYWKSAIEGDERCEEPLREP